MPPQPIAESSSGRAVPRDDTASRNICQVQGNRGFAHDHENRLLSIQAVAEISGLHEITIRRYVRSGELEAVRIGRRTESRQGAVEIYAEFAIIPTIGKSEL